MSCWDTGGGSSTFTALCSSARVYPVHIQKRPAELSAGRESAKSLIAVCYARAAVQEATTAKVVVPGYQERGYELHELVANVENSDAYKHVQVVETKPDGGEDGKNRELTLAAHVLLMLKDKAHAQCVVHYHRGDKRDRRAKEEVDMHPFN